MIPGGPEAPEVVVERKACGQERPVVIGVYSGSGGDRRREPLRNKFEGTNVRVAGNKLVVVPKQAVSGSVGVGHDSGEKKDKNCPAAPHESNCTRPAWSLKFIAMCGVMQSVLPPERTYDAIFS